MRRPLVAFLQIGLLALALAPTARAFAADPPDSAQPSAPKPEASTSSEDDADSWLRKGLHLELQRNWAAAIEVYEAGLRRWPDRTELRQRLQLCESHYKLGRRYVDRSFRTVLLRMSQAQAMEVYDEVLERIEGYYVDPVAVEPLLRRGLDNLEVALRDPTFLQVNAPKADPEAIRHLRETLRSRRTTIAARGRDEARGFVAWACDQARSTAGIAPSPIVMEFAFGACDALDDYTNYLTPDRLDDLFGLIDGNFVGLGVELKQDDLGLRLVNVLKGGPAWDAGIRATDKITHIGGQSLKGLGLDESAAKLQGAEGSAVDLIIRSKEGGSRSVRLIRRPVEVQSVAQARIVEPTLGVGYIQLVGFQKTSTEELRRAIAGLERQGMRTLVLDLRGNPGGLLNVAVEIADLFLDSGVIVSTRGRAANQSATYVAQPGAPWRMPLLVMVDHDSASASEILAGALKDNRRAVVVGERSYGKGSVQSIYPLRTAPAGLKLTTAKFYSPRDRPYSEQGVEPDVPATGRLSAKVSGDGAEAPTIEFGEPSRDPVLGRAIQQARRQPTAVRSN